MTPSAIRTLANETATKLVLPTDGHAALLIESAIVDALCQADRERPTEHELREQLIRAERDRASWLHQHNIVAGKLREAEGALKDYQSKIEQQAKEIVDLGFACAGWKEKAERAHGQAVPVPIPGVHSLDELQEIIKARFGEAFEVTQTERGDGSGSAVLSIAGVAKASWSKRLVGNSPRDGVTPRGPAEYYDLKFL